MYDTDYPKRKASTCCDSEDIVNQVDVAFGIELKPAECERMITVGDLLAAILEKLGPDLGDGCVSQAAFHRVRRVLMEHYGVSREAIRPDCKLLDLVPALGPTRTRRREWKTLSDRLEYHLPELGLSKIESAILLLIAIACLTPACLAPIYLSPAWRYLAPIPILLVVVLLALRVIVNLLNRFAPSRFVVFPKECATVAGLVKNDHTTELRGHRTPTRLSE